MGNTYMDISHTTEYIMTGYYDIVLGLIPVALLARYHRSPDRRGDLVDCGGADRFACGDGDYRTRNVCQHAGRGRRRAPICASPHAD